MPQWVGGGLVQVPALLHALPNYSLATVFGTNKLAVFLLAIFFSIFSYVKRIKSRMEAYASNRDFSIRVCIFRCFFCVASPEGTYGVCCFVW